MDFFAVYSLKYWLRHICGAGREKIAALAPGNELRNPIHHPRPKMHLCTLKNPLPQPNEWGNNLSIRLKSKQATGQIIFFAKKVNQQNNDGGQGVHGDWGQLRDRGGDRGGASQGRVPKAGPGGQVNTKQNILIMFLKR